MPQAGFDLPAQRPHGAEFFAGYTLFEVIEQEERLGRLVVLRE